jgi:hypothetical protein
VGSKFFLEVSTFIVVGSFAEGIQADIILAM